MLPDNHFKLVTLGRLTLAGSTDEEDASLSKQRRKLALLTVLAMARRPIARDTLVEMFWGEQDEARARHSLSNALSCLRRRLGAKAITTRDAEVALSSDAPLVVDALDLANLVEAREFGRAAALYGGPFLDGCYVDGSSSFDQWMSRERRRIESLFLQACAHECGLLARARRWPECHALAKRWLDAQPLSSDAALYLLNATKAPGTRTALGQALEEYDALRSHLAREFDLLPEPAVRSLAEGIREQLAAAVPEPASQTASPPPTLPATIEHLATKPQAPKRESRPVPRASSRSRAVWNRRVARTVAGAAIATSLLAFSSDTGDLHVYDDIDVKAAPSKPVVAVLGIDLRSDDSTIAWLADGLPQMIAGQLAHNSALDVTPAARVRSLLVRRGGTDRVVRESVGDAMARDLARRIGATLEARGSLVRDGDKLVLDLMVHDVGSGTLLQNVVITRTDPIRLADEAAARILSVANVSAPGPQMGIETSSIEAYQHFTRGVELGSVGRLTEYKRELEAAIALDSGFYAAVRSRRSIAMADRDGVLAKRLTELLKRYADRATELDRLDEEAEAAFYGGERERSEALARAMMRRFPRDPRAYGRLEATLGYHGALEEAERVAMQHAAIDSLAMTAGNGQCTPCYTYFAIVSLQWQRFDLKSAAEWARKWIQIQPDGASAWSTLAWTYAYAQQTDSALPMMRRAITLSRGDLWARDALVRMLIVSRRYAAADSAIVAMEEEPSTSERAEKIADLKSILARERGQYRESTRIMKEVEAAWPGTAGLADIIIADNARILGDYVGASRRYESIAHPPGGPISLPIPSLAARGFCWMHALGADSYAGTGDTITLKVKADTLERGCTRSFYGRDWGLYHHVRGLIAARAGRYAEAEREFKQARWTSVEGWARPTVELANAQAALGRPRDAIATLRNVYATRLDAMGRYVPISEADFRMAKLFAQTGQADSARVYSGYVRAAWRSADPEVQRLVATLP
jgi:DNA-binding SARP family transcriptional activator/TolB-like protein